jgi:hypothetical protein
VYRALSILAIVVALSGCVSLVAPYDPQFEQELNKFSQDTAKFLAAAAAGGPERSNSSTQTVAYYAESYNLLDRLSARAKLKRGRVPCATNKLIVEFDRSERPLPDDYLKFDCLESQLYAVGFLVDQLAAGHTSGSTLNKGEIGALGTPLQIAIMGTIQTFLVTKT